MVDPVRNPTADLIRNMRAMRKSRGWSAELLATAMRTAGVPWERAVVAKLETGRRAQVTVAELFALATVFGVEPLDLIDCCPRCLSSPPPGFRCLDCNREGDADV